MGKMVEFYKSWYGWRPEEPRLVSIDVDEIVAVREVKHQQYDEQSKIVGRDFAYLLVDSYDEVISKLKYAGR